MSKILQLKISLIDIKPEIWRTFEVEESISFAELHNIIQIVMGWDNDHQFLFEISKTEILKDKDSENILLSEKLLKEKQRFKYVYDFGNDWQHAIYVEKIFGRTGNQHYPICIDGERNCPPEDCGGADSFKDLMKVLKNPNHPEYEEQMEWLGDDYEPEYFNLKGINTELDQTYS